MQISDTDHISHFGVKGMKWGVRKESRSPGASGSSKPNHLSTLDDAQLKRAVERMRLEQQYSDLAKGRSTEKTIGKKFAEQAMTESGKQVVRAVTTAAIGVTSAAIATALMNRRIKKNPLPPPRLPPPFPKK